MKLINYDRLTKLLGLSFAISGMYLSITVHPIFISHIGIGIFIGFKEWK